MLAPRSITIDPIGSCTGNPQPSAAATGRAIRPTSRAPAARHASTGARLCGPLIALETDATNRGRAVALDLGDEVAQRLSRALQIDDRAVLDRPDCGDVAAIEELQRLAAAASAPPVRASTAMTLGAAITSSPPRAHSTVVSVPRSTPIPPLQKPVKDGSDLISIRSAIRQLAARGPERGAAPAIRALPQLSATGVRSTFSRPILCGTPGRTGSAR
jgi:hypothetical protein